MKTETKERLIELKQTLEEEIEKFYIKADYKGLQQAVRASRQKLLITMIEGAMIGKTKKETDKMFADLIKKQSKALNVSVRTLQKDVQGVRRLING